MDSGSNTSLNSDLVQDGGTFISATTLYADLTTGSDHLPVVADYSIAAVATGTPTVGSFVANPASVNVGTPTTLTAGNVTESGGSGSITGVNFYLESNSISGLQIGSDTLVGAGTQSGTTWTISASTTGLADGTYTYYAVATDSNGKSSAVASTTLTVTGGPTVTINQAAGQADPTSASPIDFTVVFGEPVSDFTTGEVTLSGTAGATTAVVSGSGTTYTVAVSGMTTGGSVIATVPAGVARDSAGNPNLASTSSDNTVTYVLTPRVVNVVVGSDAWTNSFVSYLATQSPSNAGGYSIPVGSGAQLLPLPWTNIDEITVTFNENVTVDQTDLMLEGVNTPSYNVGGGTFAYNAAAFTATWTLPAYIGDDKLLLELNADGADPIHDASGNRLDGAWTNPATTSDTGTSQYPSGNGTPGSDNFLFRFNVLPGNVSQNGYVQALDGLLVRGTLGSAAGQGNYSIFKDVNGDGNITASDGLLVLGRLATSLPVAAPVAAAFPAAMGNKEGSSKPAQPPITAAGRGAALGAATIGKRRPPDAAARFAGRVVAVAFRARGHHTGRRVDH